MIYDGAWVSTDPTDASKGVPLDFHDKATYGVFDISLLRHSMPSLDGGGRLVRRELAVDATLTVQGLDEHVNRDFDKLTMSTAKEL